MPGLHEDHETLILNTNSQINKKNPLFYQFFFLMMTIYEQLCYNLFFGPDF